MLRLEMVRFCFMPNATYSVIYSRSGWSCFAMEHRLGLDGVTDESRTAIPEGLYHLAMMPLRHDHDLAVTLTQDGKKPYRRITVASTPYTLHGEIGVGYQLDTTMQTLNNNYPALSALIHMVSRERECYLSVRHLDNLQSDHLLRLTQQAGS